MRAAVQQRIDEPNGLSTVMPSAKKQGLYANIHAKQERIAHGSGEKMRKPGSAGSLSDASFDKAAEGKKATAKGPTPKASKNASRG